MFSKDGKFNLDAVDDAGWDVPRNTLWFPLFVAWLLKALLLKLGGLRMYRTGIPFFLGLTIGHFFMAGISGPPSACSWRPRQAGPIISISEVSSLLNSTRATAARSIRNLSRERSNMALTICKWKYDKQWVYSITYDEALEELHRFAVPFHEELGIPGHVEAVAGHLGVVRQLGQSSYNGYHMP